MHGVRITCKVVSLLLVAGLARADTLTDDFGLGVDYLTNGIVGTMWDGLYTGAGGFNNSGFGGSGPGDTLQCDAHLSAANTLTVRSRATDWEHAGDDGFFLYKVVRGDFSVVVHVVSPFDSAAYNTAGLQARAFEPNGDPLGGSEDFVSWTRFDEFGFANYLRNQVDGATAQINPGDAPNNSYWLRMDRVGTTFQFYQKATSGGAWELVSFPSPVNGTSLDRPDLAGEPLQVGIIHATYNVERGVQFTDFSLTATNFDSWVSPPSPVTGLTLLTNDSGNLELSWQPGTGSSGSLVVVWDGTNNVVKQRPVNGITYAGHPNLTAGDPLPASDHHVAYAGSGTNVTVSNLTVNAQYNVAVFAYAGSGPSIAYSPAPATASVIIPPNQLVARLQVQEADVVINFSANPGKWYWLQYTDGLAPPDWHDVVPGPLLANSDGMVVAHVNGAMSVHRFYRLEQLDPDFSVETVPGGISSLKRSGDVFDTDYLAGTSPLGHVNLAYRQGGGGWLTARTGDGTGIDSESFSTSADGTTTTSHYEISAGLSGPVALDSAFTFRQDALVWTLSLTNSSAQTVEVGDLALPLPMNTTFSGASSSVFKHSFISGSGSFLFWMRPNSVGPFLTMTPDDQTWLEYWDTLNGGYEVYVHSLAQGAVAAAQGTEWRQPHTSLSLLPGTSQSYRFEFQWAEDYDGVRQLLVDEGKLDVHVVPGMTVPTNLIARIALRTTQTLNSVEAEFPAETMIQPVGTNGDYHIYEVRFSRLGENQVSVNVGSNRVTRLEFFVTEPLETLIKKRGAFIANHQITDPSKWYDGLLCEYNMDNGVQLTPDNYDLITGWRIYAVTCDDPGLSHPAYLASKCAAFPVQSEIDAMDDYLENFVWGGLQRTTNETYSYGVYGIPDWYQNRNSGDPGTGGQLHIWRIYDYPHLVVMYWNMYQVARDNPQVSTALSAEEYLRRAYGSAVGLYTIPLAVSGWSAYQTGLMNELIVVDLIRELESVGWTSEAATLRGHWEQKVDYFVNQAPDLFGSEYAFDSTGFEATHQVAKYAVEAAPTNAGITMSNALRFLDQQMAANLVVRGWLEPAYYYLGSDYRATAGDAYVLSYMSQMGGWSVLDYAVHFATNASPYLRLGYASYLSAWALMNTGTAASNYGYWYPGAAQDGGCGGGFEPAPYGTTWLGQPHHRGSWYYASEIDLGYCGALRTAATVLADDDIFGRFCYGGGLQQTGSTNQVIPLDGLRRRFYAILDSGQVLLELRNDHFAADQAIGLDDDLSGVNFMLETSNSAEHDVILRFSSSAAGGYTVSDGSGTITNFNLQAGEEVQLALPMEAGVGSKSFSIH